MSRVASGSVGIVLAAALWPLGARAQSAPSTTRLAPLATLVMREPADAPVMGVLRQKGLLRPAVGDRPARVATLVRFQGPVPDLAALGGEVRGRSGDVVAVDVPPSALGQLAALAGVTYVDLAMPLRPQLDVAVPATGASAMRSGTPPDWSGDTGRNVIVAILDTGIDFSHRDFRDSAGNSRILQLFDYTTAQDCTQAQIDALECHEVDTEGHGSEVAGIAAGNGAATGNGQLAYRYVGMAPEASLVVAKADWTTANIVQAVGDVEAFASSLGRPVVINLSLGTEIGPHDGTDNVSQALDNASGPGRVIVVAAGNHADDATHASGTVATDGSVITDLSVPVDTSLTLIDVWYAGADQLAIHLHNTAECDSGLVSAPVSGAATEVSFCNGRGTIVSGSVNPLNGDREILVSLATTGSNPFAATAWQVELRGTVVTNGHFDAWMNGSSSHATFTTNLDATDTLNDLATATAPITVAAYTTKNTWESLAGSMSASTPGALEAIAYFSSAGPRRACSAASLCPPVQKPELTAPGAYIASALSAQTVWPTGTCVDCYTDLDGVHRFGQGTSFAAPMVSGAVALLLQVAPTADPSAIKDSLERYAAVDAFVGEAPNDSWGYGKLDVKAAFDALPVAPPAAPTGLAAAVSAATVNLSWSPVAALDLDGYTVYRSTSSGGTAVKVATVSYRNTTYADAVPAAGTYFYSVRALDTKAQESLPSAQVSAAVSSVPAATSSASGGGGDIDPTLLVLALAAAFGLRRTGGRRVGATDGS